MHVSNKKQGKWIFPKVMVIWKERLALGCKIINESEENNITGGSSKGTHISNCIKLKPSKILIFLWSFEDWSVYFITFIFD